MIVAVDGPAASGKGSIAKAIANEYGLPHLDTGLLYRAVGVAMRRADCPFDDSTRAAELARTMPDDLLEDDALRTRSAGADASVVSAHPAVREALLFRQKSFARQDGGAVLDGRDIGTVIAPGATIKLYVTATVEERAKRRARELNSRGEAVEFVDVLADLKARDERDSGRAAAPLTIAKDAFVLDTTTLGLEASIAAALEAVHRALD
ncbi:MAG: (d)CMP kinase [Pacificimonas sp.]